MTLTTMVTGTGHGAANATAFKADVAAASAGNPVTFTAGATYDMDAVVIPSGQHIYLNPAATLAKLRPAGSLVAPLIQTFNSPWDVTGKLTIDMRVIGEIALKIVGSGDVNFDDLDIANLGRPTYHVAGSYGVLLSSCTGAVNIGKYKCRGVFNLKDGTLGNQPGLARAFATFNCDDVTISNIDLGGMGTLIGGVLTGSDDGDFFQVQDTRFGTAQGTVLIDGGTITVNGMVRRWGKQLNGQLTVQDVTIVRDPAFVTYDGTTQVGPESLNGFDMVDAGAGSSCHLLRITDHSKAFKVAIAKTSTASGPITVENCDLQGTTDNAHNSFADPSQPTIGVYNAGGGTATYIGTAPSGFDTNKSGTWV